MDLSNAGDYKPWVEALQIELGYILFALIILMSLEHVAFSPVAKSVD